MGRLGPGLLLAVVGRCHLQSALSTSLKERCILLVLRLMEGLDEMAALEEEPGNVGNFHLLLSRHRRLVIIGSEHQIVTGMAGWILEFGEADSVLASQASRPSSSHAQNRSKILQQEEWR